MRTKRSTLLTSTAIIVAAATGTATIASAQPSAPRPATHHHATTHHKPAHQQQFTTTGRAFGSRIQIHHSLVGSGRSARSTLRCGATNKTRDSNTAQVNLGALAFARAIRTRSQTTPNAHGRTKTVERAKTARVSLLKRLITVKAIRATAIAHARKTHATVGRSQFLGLRIGGKAYTNNPKPNTSLTIPGIAQLTLNAQHRSSHKGVRSISVDALRLTLLKGDRFGPIGTTVVVGHAMASRHLHHKSTLRGASSGTQLHVAGLVTSHPTFQTKLPCGAKRGAVFTHKGAGVNIPSVLKTGVIRTNAKGHANRRSMAKTRTKIARVNLLKGLVKVRALRSQSVARLTHGKISTRGSGSTFLGLSINGKPMPIRNAPNTSVNLLGIGTLWLNRTVSTKHGLEVHALELVLDKPYAGLAAGTVVDVANTRAYVKH